MGEEQKTPDELSRENQCLRKRIQALEASDHQNRYTQSAVDAQTDTFFLFDPATGKAILWNKAFRDLSGYSDEDIGAMKAPESWYSEADLAKAAQVIEKTSAGEQSTVELDLITRSGRTVPTEYKTAMIDDHAGPPYIISVGRDLTARRAQEDLLIRERKKYLDFLDNLDAGVVAHAPDTSIFYCNRRAPEILGLSLDQLMGKTARDPQWRFIHEDGTDIAPDDYPVSRIRASLSRLEHYVVGIVGPDGNPKTWAICNGLPVLNEEGALDHILISFFDITERKQALDREKVLNENLARAKRMESLGLLAGGVAHDLNNMLGPMLALPELILDDLKHVLPEDDPVTREVVESLDAIRSSAHRAAKVVRDLVGLSRSGIAQRVPTPLAALPCFRGSDDMLTDLQDQHPEVAITYQLEEDALAVMGETEGLMRILQNLILNAVQAIETRGQVTVGAGAVSLAGEHPGFDTIPPGEYARIVVRDTGRGIDPDDVDHIFEPFFTRKARGEHTGSGLGLSVVHRLVRDFGGYIDVRSRPGEGTALSVWLPRIVAPIPEAPAPDLEPVAAGAETILIVDDEPAQRFLASRSLRKHGYQTQQVENGRNAVALFVDHRNRGGAGSPFDLVILDMIMEADFDGLDTLNAVLKIHPRQKVVIASGHAEDGRATAAQDLGAKWIAKPYLLADLARLVRKTLDNSTEQGPPR